MVGATLLGDPMWSPNDLQGDHTGSPIRSFRAIF